MVRTDPDATAEVTFVPSEKGGRRELFEAGALTSLFEIDGRFYSCRIWKATDESVVPGGRCAVEIKFVLPISEIQGLEPGARFYLVELRRIGEGVVTGVRKARDERG